MPQNALVLNLFTLVDDVFGTSRDLDLVMIRFEQMVSFHFEPFPRIPGWPSYRMDPIPYHLHHEHEVSLCYIKRGYQKNAAVVR